MITGRMATDEHRELFAVPGDIGRPASVGCNLLIRDGGWPVLGVDDLREAVDRILGPARPQTQAVNRAESGIGVPPASPLVAACDPAGTPIDELAKRCNQSVTDVLVAITELELAGVVRVEAGRVVPQ
jgi:DNA processing protein